MLEEGLSEAFVDREELHPPKTPQTQTRNDNLLILLWLKQHRPCVHFKQKYVE